ncbi:uncharacterized protein LOC131328370 [Rhododendron vialii]|uniref:uncharacterized protein LOC131328370 n=1 Tax=Rhododendron vialii TaxID=182163 RepID=UPI00265F355E|nr:uncharacterized protein LOC131328370 [Rhododendron vialii]
MTALSFAITLYVTWNVDRSGTRNENGNAIRHMLKLWYDRVNRKRKEKQSKEKETPLRGMVNGAGTTPFERALQQCGFGTKVLDRLELSLLIDQCNQFEHRGAGSKLIRRGKIPANIGKFQEVHFLGNDFGVSTHFGDISLTRPVTAVEVHDALIYGNASIQSTGNRRVAQLIRGNSSLFQKLFKGKYFPNSSFWDAPCPGTVSWAWRKITSAEQYLKRVALARWKCRHWTDPWLPHTLSFTVLRRPQVSNRADYQVERVTDLIDWASHSWKEDLVKEIFGAIDTEAILSIPISYHGVPDKGIWHHTSDGIFTVRSAYHAGTSLNLAGRTKEKGESSSGSTRNLGWKISASNKVEFFIWRCLHNAIATSNNLHHRQMDVNPYCPVCHKERETTEHLLFGCKGSKEVWCLAGRFFQPSCDWKSMDFPSWWTSLSQGQQIAVQILIFEKAHAAWEEYLSVLERKRGELHVAQPNQAQKWEPPPTGVTKLNVDGAMNKDSGLCEMGMVARKSEGIIVGAASQSMYGQFPPRVIETMGFRFALTEALNHNLTRIEVEGDAKHVVQAIKGEKAFADCDSIILDCIKLASQFTICVFSPVKHGYNRVADSTAKHFLLRADTESWREDVPSWLVRTIGSLAPFDF